MQQWAKIKKKQNKKNQSNLARILRKTVFNLVCSFKCAVFFTAHRVNLLLFVLVCFVFYAYKQGGALIPERVHVLFRLKV